MVWCEDYEEAGETGMMYISRIYSPGLEGLEETRTDTAPIHQAAK